MKKIILIVEDNPAVSQMIGFLLSNEKFTYKIAQDAKQARKLLETEQVALILMDWMLPGATNGIDLVVELKSNSVLCDIPIIMLTAKGEEGDKVKGFTYGVEDYVSKPFSAKELMLRIKALLKRAAPLEADQVVHQDGILLDPVRHIVTVDARPASLSPTEFRLLHYFMVHPDKVITRAKLLDAVWGIHSYPDERTVDVHIRRLRRALKQHTNKKYIRTVRGAGYCFRPDKA